jgi:hypothetical protein
LALESTVFQHAGVCQIIRHDRDSRFEGELFQVLNRALGVTQRATLAYNPKGNGHVENKNRYILQVLRRYCEDVNQEDWPLHLKAVCFALNVSFDVERGDTSLYLFHGWDAQTTMEAMCPTAGEVGANRDAKQWRRDANKVYNQVTSLVRNKYRRQQLKRAEKTLKLVRGKPFQVGDRVWLYAPDVKLDENRKLAHCWVGPYRVRKAVADQPHYYELEVPSNSQMFPAIHFDRLKLCFDRTDRPTEKLVSDGLSPIEFDESLLPSDSFETAPGYVRVLKLLDRRWTRATRRAKPKIEYLVLWVDGSESWVMEYDLHCYSLLQDYEKLHGEMNPPQL